MVQRSGRSSNLAWLRIILVLAFGIFSVTIPRSTSASTANAPITTQNILAPSFHIHTIIPNDPQFSSQPALTKIDLPNAWDASRGSATVKVGIIDTGIDGTHIDLAGRVGAGYNFIANNVIPASTNSDDNGHGTLIAGVIGALTNNGIGIAGVDWVAELVPLKVANSNGEANASTLSSAIIYAADHGIRIVNMSLGSPTGFSLVNDAVTYATAHGVVMVASSGNNNSVVTNPNTDCATVCYPAAYSGVIAVGSVDNNDVRSSFSNYGPELDLVAPGEGILTTALGNHTSYTTVSGTSLAAPFVTGVSALFVARFNSSAAQILATLESQADKPVGMSGQNYTNQYGFGRINAARAVFVKSGYSSQSTYPGPLYPGDAYQFEIRYLNTGKSTWYQGQFNLGTDHSSDRTPVFTRGSGWLSNNRVGLVEASVAPGALGTFRFTYVVPVGLAPGVYREHFRPVLDGVSWLDDYGVFWDIDVRSIADKYHSSWVSQNSYPTLLAGQSYQFELVVKNTGTITWQPNTVHLGTSHPMDRTPVLTRADTPSGQPAGWLSNNRIALVESSVAPNNNATFRFYYTIPTGLAPGVYREYFQPVADGITWLEDQGIYWDVRVLNPAPGYHAEWVSQNSYPTLIAGQSNQFELRMRNTGTETWQRGVVNLGTDHPGDRIPVFTRGAGWISTNRVTLVENSVAPNEIGTFRFTDTVPLGLAPGIYREYFTPVADGITWLEDKGIYWDITVQ